LAEVEKLTYWKKGNAVKTDGNRFCGTCSPAADEAFTFYGVITVPHKKKENKVNVEK